MVPLTTDGDRVTQWGLALSSDDFSIDGLTLMLKQAGYRAHFSNARGEVIVEPHDTEMAHE